MQLYRQVMRGFSEVCTRPNTGDNAYRQDICRVPLGSESPNYEIGNTRFRNRSETPLDLFTSMGVVHTAEEQQTHD